MLIPDELESSGACFDGCNSDHEGKPAMLKPCETTMTFYQVLTSFIGPLTVNRLLKSVGTFVRYSLLLILVNSYIETGGEGVVVKPWVWIIVLLIGPSCHAMTFQWYHYLSVSIH